MNMSKCPICRKDFFCTQEDVPDYYTRIRCKTFDFDFLLSSELFEKADGDEIKEKSMDIIAEHLLRHPLCRYDRWRFFYNPDYTKQDTDPLYYINIAEKLKGYPTTVSDITNRTLLNLAILAPHYGDSVSPELYYRRFYFEHNDNPIPLSGVLSMLEEMDLLIHQSEFSFKISAKGWERIDELRNKENEIKQGFIAMSFDDVAVSICEAFKEAIDAAGYAFYISKEKEHNNQVVPEMLFEIQRSKFMVVDVTYPNYGAYYEAGYAQALGKQVIICCRKAEHESQDKNKRPHFDIAQKQIIVWETKEELVRKLKRRIEATVR